MSAHASSAARASTALTWIFLAAAAASSIAGLAWPGVYRDPTAWATEALRGGDLTTLVLVVPALAAALVLAGHGSARAQLVRLGLFAYGVYNFAFYAFGAEFSSVFLLHVAAMASALYALITGFISTDVVSIGERFDAKTPARTIGGFLIVIACIFATLWTVFSLQFAFRGTLRLGAAPLDGVQLVFALDLALLTPSLATAGVLLWRRRPLGFVLATLMAVFGTAYQVNLAMAGVFQSLGDVTGVGIVDPMGIGVLVAFVIVAAMLLRSAPSRVER